LKNESLGEKRRPLILEIKGNSLDDGPGIRTVVFFKGCPLSCVWCHNPESKSAAREISFDATECVGCGTCLETCKEGALGHDNPTYIDRDKCTLCLECVDTCPSGALTAVGRFMEAEEIAEIIEKDLPFFRTSGGGVTLSGGEPLLFMDYTSRLLQRLKEMGVHTIVETCGHFELDDFEERILPYLDAIYFDLKIHDPDEHKRQCGIPNQLIQENFGKLFRAYLDGGTPVLARIPLIPGITASDGNLAALADFLTENGVKEVALLQYNPLWIEKSRKLGRDNPLAGQETMTTFMKPSEIARCHTIFESFDII
jgi:pyruvate formate lyase activating enzyme